MTAQSWRRIITWAIRLLLLAVLALISFAIAVLTVIPRATHGAALTVLTGSMTPTIPVGSVVIDRPVDPGTLHVGDIATYQKEPGKAEYITHRIIRIDSSTSPTTFTFKGDANRGPDLQLVPATAIRGRVWFHVPILGAIRDTLHTKGGLAGVAMLALAGYALYQGAGALRDKKLGASAKASLSEAPDARVTNFDLDRAAPQFSLLLTLRADAFEDLEPADVCRVLGASLLGVSENTFSAIIARADRARDALELIDALGEHAGSEYKPEQSAYVPVTLSDEATIPVLV